MFNNGYNSFYPGQNIGYKHGLFSSLRGKFNWSSILNNTQKTLNIINQAIPVFYQIKPVWNNTKTIFKVIGAMKEDNTTTTHNNITNKSAHIPNNENYNQNTYNDNTPNFFL